MDLVERIKLSAESRYGTKCSLPAGSTIEVYLPDSNRIIDAASENLVSQVKESVQRARVFAINVGGRDIAWLRDKDSAEQVLERLKAPYKQNAGFSVVVDFAENVSIEERIVRTINWRSFGSRMMYIAVSCRKMRP